MKFVSFDTLIYAKSLISTQDERDLWSTLLGLRYKMIRVLFLVKEIRKADRGECPAKHRRCVDGRIEPYDLSNFGLI